MSTARALCSKVASWILIVYASTAIVRLILLSDSNKRVYNHSPGPCRVLQGIKNGSAGIEYVHELNIAFITNGLGAMHGKGIGRIFTYSFKQLEGNSEPHAAVPLLIEPSATFDQTRFAPHGLSAYVSKGRVSLYVVNAHPERQCVEVFVFHKDKQLLAHRKSICDSRFSSLVDVSVVGADRFFVTNLAYFSRGWLQYAELAMQSSFGSLLFYDGRRVEYVERFLGSPSGVFYDAPRRRLIVGSLLNEMLRVFTMNADLSLRHTTDIGLLTSPVGIYADKKTGDLITATHPVFFSAFMHWSEANQKERQRTPSQVLRIRIQEDGVSWVITEPYANDGATIAGGNAVAWHGREEEQAQLLVGTLFGKALLCAVENPQIT